MKNLITKWLPALLMFFPFALQAQTLSGGVIGGASMGAVKITSVDNRFVDGIHGDYIFGAEAGVYAKLGLGPLYVRPQLMYRFQSGEVKYREVADAEDRTGNFSTHRIQVPVMIGLHILGPLAIEAGPSYNYMLYHTKSFGDDDLDLARSGLGYRVGPALDFATFIIYANYEGMLNNNANANYASFREPYRINFGIGLALGGNSNDSVE